MIGSKIQQLRKDNGMSQEDLALKLTISRQAVSKWELGEATPDTENIVQLSKLFCISTDYLLINEFECETKEAISDTEQSDFSEHKEELKNETTEKSHEPKQFIKKPVAWVTISALAILVVLSAILLTRTNFVSIYVTQHESEVESAYSLLLEMGVAVRVDGDSILVPEKRADELRIALRTHGMPIPLQSSHDKKLYEAHLATEMKTQILQLHNVENVLVMVDLIEASYYNDASVSVVLTPVSEEVFIENDILKVVEIIRKSLPHISDENISITDSNLHFYR